MNKTIVRVLSTTAFLSLAYAGAAHANTYTVQKGDNLTKIARTHQTTVADLKTWNGLTSDLIYINQTLKVSTAAAAPQQAVQPAQPAATYTVVKGDALIKIANRFNVTVGELKEWNGLTGTLIYIGQTLNVSAPGQTGAAPIPAPAPAPSPAPVAPSTPAPAPVAPPSEGATVNYTIQSGDSLSKIAVTFGTTVGQLKTLNNLTSDIIYAGRTLLVPGQAGSSSPVSPPAPAVGSNPAPSELSDSPLAGKMVDVAKGLMGIPYVWGGSTLSGFDCSGFIYYVANQSGKKIGRYSAAGYYDRSYYVDKPQVGDLVFFANTYKKGISHLGIYLGNNQFIHANSSNGVMISNLSSAYYTKHFEAFKRFY